jgi:hypothetical protein
VEKRNNLCFSWVSNFPPPPPCSPTRSPTALRWALLWTGLVWSVVTFRCATLYRYNSFHAQFPVNYGLFRFRLQESCFWIHCQLSASTVITICAIRFIILNSAFYQLICFVWLQQQTAHRAGKRSGYVLASFHSNLSYPKGFHGITQPLQENKWIVPRLSHDRFLSNPEFIRRCTALIRSHCARSRKSRVRFQMRSLHF